MFSVVDSKGTLIRDGFESRLDAYVWMEKFPAMCPNADIVESESKPVKPQAAAPKPKKKIFRKRI